MLDLDITKGTNSRKRNETFQKSLVQVVFVTRTKVTPENSQNHDCAQVKLNKNKNGTLVLRTKPKVGTRRLTPPGAIVKKDDVGDNSKLAKNSASFGFKNGFLMKKKRRPNPALKGNAKSLLRNIDLLKRPKLISEGNVSLVYKLFNSQEVETGIFKPYDAIFSMEKEGKFNEDDLVLSSKQHAMNEVCAYKLDQQISVGARAAVPETQHVELPKDMFNSSLTNNRGFLKGNDFIRGSLQQFVPDAENCGDYGPSIFTTDDVHKIGVLDLRILNCDRHTGNMLVKRTASGKELVPIDHALSFPSFDATNTNHVAQDPGLDKDLNNLKLAHVSFDWMLFPQSKKAFSKDLLKGIKSINIVKNMEIMKRHRMTVNQRLAVFMSSTILKKGALEYGLTLHELGSVVQRTGDRTKPSVLERLSYEAMEGVDAAKLEIGDESQVQIFCRNFTTKLEQRFQVSTKNGVNVI